MDINAKARDILAMHGVDIDDLGDAPPPDVAAIMTENATRALDEILPKDFRNASITDGRIARWVKTFLASPTDMEPLLLIGPVGAMKTTNAIAALIAAVLGMAERRMPLTWVCTTHPRLNASLRPAENDAHLVAYDAAETAGLLVLDDLGTGLSSDWTGDTLYRIVDARWSNHRPTIFTSNLTPEKLRQVIGDRIVSRAASGQTVVLKNRDMRAPAANA